MQIITNNRKAQIIAYITILLMLTCCICGCNQKATNSDTNASTSAIVDNTTNKAIIMNALNVKNEREIKTIINTLNTINTGNIINATASQENETPVLDITTENETTYRLYLTKNNTVEAVKNLKTNEWVITSTQ